MATRNRLRFQLVKILNISNKEATSLVADNRIKVNGVLGELHQIIYPEDEIRLDDKVIREAKKLVYIAYYKPPGVECTFNRAIPDNLHAHISLPEDVFYLGRLDKASEGLLLFTNNGRLHDRLLREEHNKEKEYLVTVNKPVTSELLQALSAGIIIMGKKTKPARVFKESENIFRIILTQGLNRQIRRMCYKCGYEVEKLLRIRIDHVLLGELKIGEWKTFEPQLKRF